MISDNKSCLVADNKYCLVLIDWATNDAGKKVAGLPNSSILQNMHSLNRLNSQYFKMVSKHKVWMD